MCALSQPPWKKKCYDLTGDDTSLSAGSSLYSSSDSSTSSRSKKSQEEKDVIKQYASFLEKISANVKKRRKEMLESTESFNTCVKEEFPSDMTIKTALGVSSSSSDPDLFTKFEDSFDDVPKRTLPQQQVSSDCSTLCSASSSLTSSFEGDIILAMVPDLPALNDRYRRLLKIGEGRFGEVYIVYDRVAKVYLTMKRVNHFLHVPRRFPVGLHKTTLREVELLSILNHPNIVSLVDYHLLLDGTLLLFLPLLRHDFVSLIRTWTFGEKGAPPRVPLHVVKCFFRQIIEGVGYLHDKNIAHRDLKPNNIMVDEWGVVRIIDFGWGRIMPGPNSSHMATPPCAIAYRPPELLIGQPHCYTYDFSVDVWCCGCILFELLTGHCLGVGRNEKDAMSALERWLGSPPPDLSLFYDPSTPRAVEVQGNVRSSFLTRCTRLSVREEDATFLLRFLDWNPRNRVTLSEARKDPWFYQSPAACSPSEVVLPSHNTFHWIKKRQRKTRI